jgi:hypothetical protein
VPFVDIYGYAVSFLDILYRSDRWVWEDNEQGLESAEVRNEKTLS